jgi:hypothetical protein
MIALAGERARARDGRAAIEKRFVSFLFNRPHPLSKAYHSGQGKFRFAPRLSARENKSSSGSFGMGSVKLQGDETYREAPLEHVKEQNFLGRV